MEAPWALGESDSEGILEKVAGNLTARGLHAFPHVGPASGRTGGASACCQAPWGAPSAYIGSISGQAGTPRSPLLSSKCFRYDRQAPAGPGQPLLAVSGPHALRLSSTAFFCSVDHIEMLKLHIMFMLVFFFFCKRVRQRDGFVVDRS